MTIVNKKLSEITPYERNAKRHPQSQIDNVAESIRQYGFVQPLVIDEGGGNSDRSLSRPCRKEARS